MRYLLATCIAFCMAFGAVSCGDDEKTTSTKAVSATVCERYAECDEETYNGKMGGTQESCIEIVGLIFFGEALCPSYDDVDGTACDNWVYEATCVELDEFSQAFQQGAAAKDHPCSIACGL